MGNDLSDEVDGCGLLKDKIENRDSAYEDCRSSGHLKPIYIRQLYGGRAAYHCDHCGRNYTYTRPSKEIPSPVKSSLQRVNNARPPKTRILSTNEMMGMSA